MQKAATCLRIEVLHFLLLNVNVCIELQYVNKILPLALLERVPDAPPYVAGLLNLAGKTIPIIDLAMRLGMTRENPYSLEAAILMCEFHSQLAGLIVDEVSELSSFDRQNIQMDQDFRGKNSHFLGAINDDKKMSLLLDLNDIFPIALTQREENAE